ncbi:MAG: helix-turn-helix domain-containing protein [Clostridium sp.]|jgi:transcriptional regulator with XRE-family HTH domain|nr:helix-turn-helix domain-containing protein [Clostridium sp.]
MEIGSKLKNARLKQNLTQEQAADALHVSRQTISNWENEKTYPDIMSVVKMSDLYDISLDHLLKEEMSVSNYVEHLEESTNVVKSKNKLSRIILIATYLGIWALSLIVFWFFTGAGDAMGYSIMYLWVLLPVMTFVVSLLIGKNNYWGRRKWFFSIAAGLMYMLAEYGTFNAANMAAFSKINMPRFGMFLGGAIISLIGLAIGAGANYLKSKIKAKQIKL